MSSCGSTTAASRDSRDARKYDAQPESSCKNCLKYMARRGPRLYRATGLWAECTNRWAQIRAIVRYDRFGDAAYARKRSLEVGGYESTCAHCTVVEWPVGRRDRVCRRRGVGVERECADRPNRADDRYGRHRLVVD